MKKSMKKFIKDYYVYILVFFIFLAIGIFVPTGGDDWEISGWYNKEGLFGLLCKSIYMWTFYNGRIMNNFFDMFISKYPFLWAIISALIHTGTIIILLKIFKLEKNPKNVILFTALVLSVSSFFRVEVQLHKIGNISYAIPAFMIFSLIYILLNNNAVKNKYNNILILLLSFASSLWIENLTISLFCFLIILFIYNFRCNKENKGVIYAFIGCVLACLIMFSSIGFLNRFSSSTGSSSLVTLFTSNFPNILSSITMTENILYIVYLICAFMSISNKKGKLIIILKMYLLIMLSYLILFTLLNIFSNYSYAISLLYEKLFNIFMNPNGTITMILSCTLLLSIPIILYINFYKNEKFNILMLFYVLSLFSVAPMFISPGERNLILLIYSLIVIIVNLFNEFNKSFKFKKTMLILLVAFLLFRLENYHFVLHNAHLVEKDRISAINNYKNNSDSNILVLPMFDNNIIGNLNSDYYKASIINYYKLPTSTKIFFDDGFILQDIDVKKQKNNYLFYINLLGKNNYTYNAKIYEAESDVLLFEESNNTNIFYYDFQSSKKYIISATVMNNKYGFRVLNKEVEV